MFTVPSLGARTLEWLTESLSSRDPQVVSGELGRASHKQFTPKLGDKNHPQGDRSTNRE